MSERFFPTRQKIGEFVDLLNCSGDNVYRLPRVLVLRQLADRPDDFFLEAFLANQGNGARNIVYEISNFDSGNFYYLVEMHFYDDGPRVGMAWCWHSGVEIERKIYKEV